MSLFILFVLLSAFGFSWGWYVLGLVVFIVHCVVHGGG